MNVKYAVGLWLFGQLGDRFTTYHAQKELAEKFAEAAKVEGIRGLEVIYPAEFGEQQVEQVNALLKEHRLEVAGIIVDVYGLPKWMYGSLTSRNEKIRREAVQLSQRAMDVAKELGCKTVTLWLGQDGYDYPFQSDYEKGWSWLVDGVKEIAEYRSDVNVSLEYKLKEPRNHLYIGTVGKAVFLAREVGLRNVGVTIDVGHALVANENPSESLVLLNRYGKLFHIHFNDNYRSWDDDMLVASVNLWEPIEFFYWLRKINYEGWISLDVYPYREDVRKFCQRSIENLDLASKLVDVIGASSLDECIVKGDPTETAAVLRRIFKS
jgi:xylose isomerase